MLITKTFDFDGGRDVSACLPTKPATAVVFAADGQATARLGELLAPDLAVAVVGVQGLTDEMERLKEYSQGFDGARFAAHEAFFTGPVRQWAWEVLGRDYPAAQTAIFGASAGGELALALGLAHPDLYGAILAGSPGGGFRPSEELPPEIPRTYLVGGTLEPFFLDNATRWASALQDAGVEVVMAEREGGHGSELWDAEFAAMVRWAFFADRP